MPNHQRGLRAELAAILSVDQYTLEHLVDDPSPPTEATSTRLANLIIHAIHHPIEARAVHSFLPVLVLRIFGFSPGQGWIETICQLPSKDRDALLSIILPDGPLHSFCKQAVPSTSMTLSTDTTIDTNINTNTKEMHYEFSLHNLPLATRNCLLSSTSLHQQPESQISYLAPVLKPYLNKEATHLLVDPMMYFMLCLVASPSTKYPINGTPEGTNPITLKKLKRSTSLPSTRALYNFILTCYLQASNIHNSTKLNHHDCPFILYAVLDFLLLPWVDNNNNNNNNDDDDIDEIDANTPVPCAAHGDSLICFLLCILPNHPDLLLNNANGTDQLLVSFVWKCIPVVLSNILNSLDRTGSEISAQIPLLSFMKLFTLYLSPWKYSTRYAIRSMIYSKQKRSISNSNNINNNANKSPNSKSKHSQQQQATNNNMMFLAANSVIHHLSNVHRTPPSLSMSNSTTNAAARFMGSSPLHGQSSFSSTAANMSALYATASESKWRRGVSQRVKHTDIPIITTMIVRCAALRIGGLNEGMRTLALLTESLQSIKLNMTPVVSNHESEEEEDRRIRRNEELSLCLESLKSGIIGIDNIKGLSKWEKGGFIYPLATCLGVKLNPYHANHHGNHHPNQSFIESSSASIANNYSTSAAWATNMVKDVVYRVNGGGAGVSPSSNYNNQHQQQQQQQSHKSPGIGAGRSPGIHNVDSVASAPFLGSVWDRPIESGEFEPMVLFAYWLALKAEPYIGYLPDTRFIGRFWFLMCVCSVAFGVMIGRAFVTGTRLF